MYCIIKFNCDYSLSGRVWARLTCSPTRYSSSVLKSSPQEDTSPLSERHAGRGRLTTGQFGLCPPKPQRMRNVSSEFLLPGLIFWRGVRKKRKTQSLGFTLIWQGGQDYADWTPVPTCDFATFDAELNSDWHQFFESTDREIFKVCLWRPKLSEAWLRLSLGSGSVWEVKNESGQKKKKLPPDTTPTELAHVWREKGGQSSSFYDSNIQGSALQDRYVICRH